MFPSQHPLRRIVHCRNCRTETGPGPLGNGKAARQLAETYGEYCNQCLINHNAGPFADAGPEVIAALTGRYQD